MFNHRSRVKETDVLVVGAGPVGLLAGVLLAERGIPFQILDNEWRSAQHNYALTLHPWTLYLLSEAGLLEEILKQGQRVDKVGLYQGNTLRSTLRLGSIKAEYPFLVILSQSYLEQVLEHRLSERRSSVLWNRRVSNLEFSPAGVKATIEELTSGSGGYAVASGETANGQVSTLDAKFVIGADGHDSVVRRVLGIPFDESGPAEAYAAIDFGTNANLGNEARLVVDGPLSSAFWPLKGNRCRGLLQLETGEAQYVAKQVSESCYSNMQATEAERLVRERARDLFSGKTIAVDWSGTVCFERHLARSFGRGRAWLCGDSAHTTGPIGVHSSNAGFREAHELVSRISRIRAGGSLALLESYSDERRADWQLMLGTSCLAAVDTRNPPWFINHQARLLASLPATGPELEQMIGLLGLKIVARQNRNVA